MTPVDKARRAASRRLILTSLWRPALAAVCLVVLYYIVPMDQALGWVVGLELVAGLVVVGVVIAWQVRSILYAEYPRLQAISAVALSLPLFLLLFATTYFLMERNTPGAFTQPMSRTDSLYFTIVVFATVGFGDITPVTETARIVTIVQMLGNIVFVGVLAKVVVGAVQRGLGRRTESGDGSASPSPVADSDLDAPDPDGER